jgi:superfamily II DNA/RNA helicase
MGAAEGFAELGVPAALVSALAANGITTPFPIQAATVPDALAARDVLGRARTGSGKTMAFALPTLARLAAAGVPRRPSRPRALVLVPTRELAAQVAAVFQPLATATGLRVMTVFGGVRQGPQVTALAAGVDVCVATPGRLEDLIRQRHARLDGVEVTVLDEADHMADLGFLPAVRRLLDATPEDGQRLLFSATLDRDIDVLVRTYLHNPVTHSVAPVDSAQTGMTHHVFTVAPDHKPGVIRELSSGQGRTLAFTRTKHAARRLARQLTDSGIPAVDLHGALSQGARERNLAAFSTGRVRVLVATDIAARGIHVDEVRLVVHVDPPAEHKAYLHRSGRTARAGADGTVVTLGTPAQTADIRQLMRRASITAKERRVSPGDLAITDLVGPPAPSSPPVAPAATARNGGTSGRRRAGSNTAAHAANGPRPGTGRRRSAAAVAPAPAHSAAAFSGRGSRGR